MKNPTFTPAQIEALKIGDMVPYFSDMRQIVEVGPAKTVLWGEHQGRRFRQVAIASGTGSGRIFFNIAST